MKRSTCLCCALISRCEHVVRSNIMMASRASQCTHVRKKQEKTVEVQSHRKGLQLVFHVALALSELDRFVALFRSASDIRTKPRLTLRIPYYSGFPLFTAPTALIVLHNRTRSILWTGASTNTVYADRSTPWTDLSSEANRDALQPTRSYVGEVPYKHRRTAQACSSH